MTDYDKLMAEMTFMTGELPPMKKLHKKNVNDDHQIKFTLFKDVFDKNTTRTAVCTWKEFIDAYLSKHAVTENKEDQWLFNGWTFAGNNGSGKGSEYAVDCSMIVLDYDDGTTIEEVKRDLTNYEFVLYTSHNHKIKGERFRVVMPLLKPISIDHWNNRKKNFLKMFSGVDKSTVSCARAFYLPSCPEEYADDAIVYKNSGIMFDAYTIPRMIKEVKPVKRGRDYNHEYSFEELQEILSKLCTLDLSGDGNGENYQKWMKIGTAMQRVGYSIHDFMTFTKAVKPNHARDDEINRKWNDFKNYSGNITMGTIKHYLNE